MQTGSLPPATPAALRAALLEASLALAGLLARSRVQPGRMQALAALRTARFALAQPDAAQPPEATTAADAGDLVAGWIAAGGDWHALAAAVNRHALTGATARQTPRTGGPNHEQ